MADPAPARGTLVRQARAAADQADWTAARAAWTAALHGAPAPPVAWSLGLLRALAGAGDMPAARAKTAAILARDPANLAARHTLLRLLADAHDQAALKEEAASGSLAYAGAGEASLPHFRATCSLGDPAAGRAVFDLILPALTAPSHLQILFDRASDCFGPAGLPARWDAIAHRLASVDAGGQEHEARTGRTLALRLDVARGHYDSFRARLAEGGDVLPGWDRRFASLARRLACPAFPSRQQRKIFGIGLSKTGTNSLAEALAILGYDTAHHRNPYTNAILGAGDADLFDAMNDGPVAARFEALYDRYPNAVFIFTERDPATWKDSVLRHRKRARGTMDVRDMAALAAADGPDSPWYRRVFSPPIYSHDDLLDTYGAFARRVAAFFDAHAPARLLRLNILEGQGWPELCAFLGHELPAAPFPYKNRDGAALAES